MNDQLPIDVGDKDPSEAIQDLSIGKIRPTEVKESTSSVQVEASTSRQGDQELTLKHPQVGHAKMKKTRKYTKINLINLLHHHDKWTTTPIMKKAKKKNKMMKKMFHPNHRKSSHEFEQELLETIPSSKSTMISKPGESLALNLVWLIFVNIINSSLALTPWRLKKHWKIRIG